jgi:hypothetical protein
MPREKRGSPRKGKFRADGRGASPVRLDFNLNWRQAEELDELRRLPLAAFAEPGTTMVEDPELVLGWSKEMCAAWVSCVCNKRFARHAELFLRHEITGDVLLKLTESDLEGMGLEHIADRIRFSEVLRRMQSRCNKPERRNLTVPSWVRCFAWEQISFGWADTSEGKSGEDMTAEAVNAQSAIALVATLLWGMAWDVFFGTATSCYCPADAAGQWETTDITKCFCSTAWDMDGLPLMVFYASSGMAAFCFMLSTIFSMMQIMMVYEMSDGQEVEVFMDMLKSDSQLPGRLLLLGISFFIVTLGVVEIYTIGVGIIPGPESMKLRVMSYCAACVPLAITVVGFGYQIPRIIHAVYASKVEALAIDRKPLHVREQVIAS